MEFIYKKFIKNYKNTKDPKVIKRYGLFASIVGILSNIILFGFKIIVALISASVSIMSDAFNNLSDAASSIITLIGFKMSSKPADKEHPYGHQRIEYICAFIISIIIIYIGLELGISSFKKIINPGNVEFSYIMLSVLALTVLIKLWQGLFYLKVSKRINSISLKASSKDSFNDVVATSIIILGLVIGKIFEINIDGYLGIIVSIYIMIGGVGLIKETINKLIGGTPNNELIEQVKTELLKEKQILGLHDVLYHYYGWNEIYMSIHVEIDSSLSLIEAHNIVDCLEKKIKKNLGVELVVHIDPIILNDELLQDINSKLWKIINAVSEKLSFHELKIINKNSKIVVKFDLEVPFKFHLNNQQIYNLINRELKNINSDYRASINFDKN